MPAVDDWWRLNFQYDPIGAPITTPTEPQTTHKAWIALIGGILATFVPILQSATNILPQPWPALITGLIALLTVLGVYKVPNKPKT